MTRKTSRKPKSVFKRAWPCNILRQRWRNRLADTLKRFRRIRGRWPDRQIIAAAHRGMEQAIAQGIQPPTHH